SRWRRDSCVWRNLRRREFIVSGRECATPARAFHLPATGRRTVLGAHSRAWIGTCGTERRRSWQLLSPALRPASRRLALERTKERPGAHRASACESHPSGNRERREFFGREKYWCGFRRSAILGEPS